MQLILVIYHIQEDHNGGSAQIVVEVYLWKRTEQSFLNTIEYKTILHQGIALILVI